MRDRRRLRADRPGRLFDRHVDVGVSCPGDADDDVARRRLADALLQRRVLRAPALGLELLEHALHEPHRLGLDRDLIERPGLRQHAGGGPTHRFDILGTLGGAHRKHVGFAAERVDLHHLAVELHRPAVEPHPLEVLGDRHELVGRGAEVGGGEDRPLDVGLGPALELHRDAQRLVHPSLGVAVPQCGFDQRDHVAVLTLLHQTPHRRADLRQVAATLGEVRRPLVVGVITQRGIFSGVGIVGEILLWLQRLGGRGLREDQVGRAVGNVVGHAELTTTAATAEAATAAAEATTATAQAAAAKAATAATQATAAKATATTTQAATATAGDAAAQAAAEATRGGGLNRQH